MFTKPLFDVDEASFRGGMRELTAGPKGGRSAAASRCHGNAVRRCGGKLF